MSSVDVRSEHAVEVKVSYPNSLETVSFRFEWGGTLQQLWDMAYEELKEGRKPGDELLNDGGVSMAPYLGLTLLDAHDRHLCPGFIFVIKSETGGAHPDYGKPVLNTPSKAASAFEGDLLRYMTFRNATTPGEVGMRVLDPLTLIVPLTATGNSKKDDYTLRLHFGYYPEWPPSAQFVNPDTLIYDKTSDLKWLPLVQGTTELAVHADYSGQGQLVCNSMTLEFYLVNHGYNKKEHLWKPGLSFEATLKTIQWALGSQYYMGRQAA